MSVLPIDQASTLRALMGAAPATPPMARAMLRTARVIAVASGKGGVGKTSIAVNLAIALADRGVKTVLVDADLGTANVDVLLNVHLGAGLADVFGGTKNLDDVIVNWRENLRIVGGASGIALAADLASFRRAQLLDQLSNLERTNDVILLDCGAGVSEDVVGLVAETDELLLVLTPEPTSITDAYALLKVLGRRGRRPSIQLVVNQVDSQNEAQEVFKRFAAAAQRFLNLRIETWVHILRDDRVAAAVRAQRPFVLRSPRCDASTCVAALAKRVAQTPAAGRPSRGFFRRALAIFH